MMTGGTDPEYGVCNVLITGDSIPYGVGTNLICSYREPLYYHGVQDNVPFNFVGNLFRNCLLRSKFMDCIPGAYLNPTIINELIRFNQYAADIGIIAAGTNDIGIRGDSASTVLASISTALDDAWSFRTSERFQIVFFSILRRLDSFDTVVQAVNAGTPAVIASKSYAANVTFAAGVYNSTNPAVIGVNMNDPVHPNDLGATQIADAAWPDLKSAILAFLRSTV